MIVYRRYNLKLIHTFSLTGALECMVFVDKRDNYYYLTLDTETLNELIKRDKVEYNFCFSIRGEVEDVAFMKVTYFHIIGKGEDTPVDTLELKRIIEVAAKDKIRTEWQRT